VGKQDKEVTGSPGKFSARAHEGRPDVVSHIGVARNLSWGHSVGFVNFFLGEGSN